MSGLDTVKAATWALHRQAEQSGIVAAMLTGSATRSGIALYLRNLLPAYRMLDVSAAGHALLARAAAIEADLCLLAPHGTPKLLPQAEAYAACIAGAREAELLGHAYVRYLGDLNGGRIMQRRLAACLGDIAGGLRFHAYPEIADAAAFRRDYRESLDRAARRQPIEVVTTAAMHGFELTIALSAAVAAAA